MLLRSMDFELYIHANNDADVTITLTATESAQYQVTAVVGEDTNLLVFLAHHTSITSEHIFFFSDRSGKDRKWNIRQLIEMLGEVRHLLTCNNWL